MLLRTESGIGRVERSTAPDSVLVESTEVILLMELTSYGSGVEMHCRHWLWCGVGSMKGEYKPTTRYRGNGHY